MQRHHELPPAQNYMYVIITQYVLVMCTFGDMYITSPTTHMIIITTTSIITILKYDIPPAQA